ncbi:MAG: hypothetical protein HY245_10610 [Rhizobiales bacterium]|nr:hypothetical protein [Hyphomicrobiales bacterium]MBI3673848.1 hypothetical protein [Hyphomicrobiales bacterium]
MYMTMAEAKRLKVLNPPEKTSDLFERYLPYALAHYCENEWSSKFAAVPAAAVAAGATAPVWYSGSNLDAGCTGSFTDSLGSGLSSSISLASTAPGTVPVEGVFRRWRLVDSRAVEGFMQQFEFEPAVFRLTQLLSHRQKSSS